MNFLQPAMLMALPLIALPIAIHLINQRRFHTVRWGAMMFLLAANRMSRGYARIRQWLILAARTLAVLGLILAIARPLSSGWLTLAAGGRPDTTIVLLDRSPSMQQQASRSGVTKLESGRDQLAQSLKLIGSQHWLLIDSANPKPLEIASPAALTNLVQTSAVSASADLPNMLRIAQDYVRENRPGRTEIWICSDVRVNDWDSESGRWAAIRDAFLELPVPVRFHLLAYPETAPNNRAIRVTDVRRVETATGAELLLSLRVDQFTPVEGTVSIPIQIEVDGARTELSVELSGSEVELKNHSIPLDSHQIKGWGQVSIPADANLADNQFYFVYDRPTPRRTIVVSENPEADRALQLAASIAPGPGVEASVETLTPDQLESTDWDSVCLVLWHAPLPGKISRELMQTFLKRGGQVIFFPPQVPNNEEFAGLRWTEWTDVTDESAVAGWIGDQDLLRQTRSGTALPVGQLRVSRYCGLIGEETSLATLQGGAPLLARAVTDRRNVYFCTTSPSVDDSSLARDGVVLYVMVQRALTRGAASLGSTRQFIAGHVPSMPTADWQRLAGDPDALSTTFSVQAGVYQHGDKLLAINRSEMEDRPAILPAARVAGLFDRLEFDRVDEQAGKASPLLSEVWRMFLVLMMIALFAEACLCLPRIVSRSSSGTGPLSVAPVRQETAA